MPFYQKRPVVVEAMQLTAVDDPKIREWLDHNGASYEVGFECLSIGTLEGYMRANIGDYIVKGVKGEFYPCKPDIFELTYQAL